MLRNIRNIIGLLLCFLLSIFPFLSTYTNDVSSVYAKSLKDTGSIGIYTVQDIRLFKEAQNSSDAKLIVIREAKRLAILEFIRVSSENLYTQSVGIVNNMLESDLDYAIKSYKIKWEHIGINSYEAIFDFDFNPIQFGHFVDLFLKKGFEKRKILVIPVYKEFNEDFQIWDNIWFDSWYALKKDKIVVIPETLDSLFNVKIERNDVIYDAAKLKKIYNVNDIFTFYAIEKLQGEDLYIKLEMCNEFGNSVYTQHYRFGSKVNLTVFFKDFVKKIYKKIFNEFYVLQFMHQSYVKDVYDIIVFDTKNWPKIKNIIDSKFEYTIRYLCRDAVVLSLQFNKNIKILVLHLKKLGLNAFEKDSIVFIE